MLRAALFALSLLVLGCLGMPHAAAQQVQSSAARETAIEMVQVYRLRRAAGLVDSEERCWAEARASAKNQQLQALQCVRVLIAGGLIDQVMQMSEGRGPTPELTSQIQRQRFLARTAAMGMDEPTANRIMAMGAREIPLMIEGFYQAGIR